MNKKCLLKIQLSIGLFVLLSIQGFTQIGITLNSPDATPSYTLFHAYSQDDCYLIDNCGEVVNIWPEVENSTYHCKILPNGNLMYVRDNTIFERTWEGQMAVELNVPGNPDLSLVYEQIKLENGNYLCVGRRNLMSDEARDMGFRYNYGAYDVVVELNGNTGDIVWEWRISDHMIQERDASMENYGIIADHPELLNMDAISGYERFQNESFMINGMDYNAELDQIALSVRRLGEIVIIDHSTTTEEAAGHSGGNSGKGGDILYRWGNPQNYGHGSEDDRFLYYQHNPNWITAGPNAGKLICFNNGLNRPVENIDDQYSDVPVINTPVDEDGNYSFSEDEAFLPETPDLVFSGDSLENFYSGYMSGAEIIPNGNVFITEGQTGRLLELNSEGEKVWEYFISGEFGLFRAEKYPVDYVAFEGKDLTPNGPVPGHENSYDCNLTTGLDENSLDQPTFSIEYLDNDVIRVVNQSGNSFNYQLVGVYGRIILSNQSELSECIFSTQDFPRGFYVLNAESKTGGSKKAFKIIVK